MPFIHSNRKIAFFSQEKFMRNSSRMWWAFLYFIWKWFFFHICVCFFWCFFSCKRSHIIHSLDLDAVFFYPSRKKNTALSFIQSSLPQNVLIINYYRKKKCDTFGYRLEKREIWFHWDYKRYVGIVAGFLKRSHKAVWILKKACSRYTEIT